MLMIKIQNKSYLKYFSSEKLGCQERKKKEPSASQDWSLLLHDPSFLLLCHRDRVQHPLP